MYLQHFGLAQAPFSATPNTQLLLELNDSHTIFKELILALNSPDGFVMVTGLAGVGKTTLRRKLISSLRCHSNRYVVIDIPYPRVDEAGLFAAIAHELQIAETPGPQLKVNVVQEMLTQLDSGRRIAVIIDEGQCIPDSSLNALLDLSEHKHGTRMLVQVVIFTQPKFDETPSTHRQNKLRERTTASHLLTPIAIADIPSYIAMRLQLSGYNGDQLFSPDALQLISQASRGIPRLINLLAHKAMIIACAAGAASVEATHVNRAVADTAAAEQPENKGKSGWLRRIRG